MSSGDIVVKELKKCYNERVILDTTFELKAGGIYCLSAPSGSGKTTLFHILAGILDADSGSCERRDVSMVFQDDRLIASANAMRNLQVAGCDGPLKEVLDKILPEEVLRLPSKKLSGGEKRRVAIARALMHPSEILIMDEPFAGLDEETKKQVIELILSKRGGRTLLMASHDAEDALLLGAEKIRLDQGRISGE